MFQTILDDLHRYRGNSNFKDFLLTFYRNHAFRYMVYWRKIKCGSRLSLLYKWRLKRLRLKTGIEIPYITTIGKGFMMVHAYSITLNSKAVIGDNVTIYKGATVGNQKRGECKGAPIIGNRVYIGLNSTIVGKISVGDDVLIAPNSYVNINIPSHSVVIGNPCAVYHRDNATECYMENLVD